MKLKTTNEIEQVVKKLRQEGKSIVTTNGSFDLFHTGHLKNLEFAKSNGDILIVGLNSDNSIRKYKSEDRPIIPQEQRAKILAALECVNYIVIFDDEDPIMLLEKIKPDVHVKGSEYKGNIVEKDVVESNHGRLMFVERDPEDVSTTKIIEKILKTCG
jgi:rfaE bifunctional protein nucleotidyltransferase chain/domain